MKIDIPLPDEKDVLRHIAQIHELPLLCGGLADRWKAIQNGPDPTEQIASIVRYDQVLAARILGLANATAFGHAGTVDTLSRAMEIIGADQLKSILLSSLLKNHFSATEKIDLSQREQLWKHSYITARMAAAIADKRSWISRQHAYVLGVLHDVGSTAMASCFPEIYGYFRKVSIERNIPPWYVEHEQGLTHTALGERLAALWSLPEVFQSVIKFHHQPQKADRFKPEVKLIGLACILANAADYPQFLRDKATLSYCADLYITADEWEGYIEHASEIRMEGEHIWRILS